MIMHFFSNMISAIFLHVFCLLLKFYVSVTGIKVKNSYRVIYSPQNSFIKQCMCHLSPTMLVEIISLCGQRSTAEQYVFLVPKCHGSFNFSVF